MAQDVSRYLSWESIIYPDGGTCVPLELCSAAPTHRAASAARICAVRGGVRSLRPAAAPSFEGLSEAGLCEGLGNMRYADGDR